MPSFKTFISYSQIALFDGSIQKPFNNWTDELVAQGFAWRPRSVSFKTLVESGNVAVNFSVVSSFAHAAGTVRAISVPFSVYEGARIEISTITEVHPVDLSAGEYQLVFETGRLGKNSWCRFSAIPNGIMVPSILIADSEIRSDKPLIMQALPAS